MSDERQRAVPGGLSDLSIGRKEATKNPIFNTPEGPVGLGPSLSCPVASGLGLR